MERLTVQIPPDTAALIILFEHSWVIGLTDIVRQGGAVVFAGGMVTHEPLANVNADLGSWIK